MSKLMINGGKVLEGKVKISGAKNSALPIVCASLLAQGKSILYNCPDIEDVNHLLSLLEELNVKVDRDDDIVMIDSRGLKEGEVYSDLVSKLRASYYLMGVYLALFNKVDIDMPGGCNLGSRPIDLHLKAFKQLNCNYTIEDDKVMIQSSGLKANTIFLEIPSVGATINAILASVFIKGATKIENAAKEPEILDVVNYLNKMGANIKGAGTGTIIIEGVKKLSATDYQVMSDRIEAGTYVMMAAAKGHKVDIINFEQEYHQNLIARLVESNIHFRLSPNQIKILSSPKILPVNLKTGYYPGFPTDLQQVYTTVLTQAKGISHVSDVIYASRYKNCYELNKMGARIQIEHDRIIINGPTQLHGTTVRASDLRAGASLVIAGLIAEGTTVIESAHHIFRGYSGIVEKVKGLNGSISVID